MKNNLFFKILIGSFFFSVFVIFAFFMVHKHYQREVEAKVAAGNYVAALNSMRELIFLSNGINEGEIKKGCFLHDHVVEVLGDIDNCLNENYSLCREYAKNVTPRDFINKYYQIKSDPRDFSGCSASLSK